MGDQMALLARVPDRIVRRDGLFRRVFAVFVSGADDAFFDGFSSALFFALFAQPERVTRAVYFSRSLGGFEGLEGSEGLEGLESASSSDDADGEVTNANILNNAVGAAETSDDAPATRAPKSAKADFEAYDALADAAARADSVMDALVRWRDVTSTHADTTHAPFRAWFETPAPRGETDAGAQQGRGRTQIVEFNRAPRRVDANDANDDTPP